MENNFLSVIIPFKGNKKNLSRALNSIGFNEEIEIIIVDDCSDIDIKELGEELNVKLIKIKGSSKGPAYSRNLGSEYANGGYLLFIDSDVKLSKDWLEIVKEEIKFCPKNTIIQGRYKTDIDTNFFSKLRNYYCYFKYSRAQSIYNNKILSINSYCFVIKKEAFKGIGGFDENIKVPSVEDDDLGWRARKKAFNIYLSKKLKVTHMKKYNFFSLMRRAYTQGYHKVKWLLRKKDKNMNFKNIPVSLNSSSSMSKTLLSIPLAFMSLASFLSLVVLEEYIAIPLLIFFMSLFMWLNWKYLKILFKKESLFFALFGNVVFEIELLVASFGILMGYLDFNLLNREY